MPDSQMTHLPHFLSKETVYKELQEDMLAKGLQHTDVISSFRFYVIWNEKFPNVSIPKVRMYCRL